MVHAQLPYNNPVSLISGGKKQFNENLLCLTREITNFGSCWSLTHEQLKEHLKTAVKSM
jgi:hypothetical protein